MSRISTSKKNYMRRLCHRTTEGESFVLYGNSVVNAISREEKYLDKTIHHLDHEKRNSIQHLDSEIELFKHEHHDEGRSDSKMSTISEAGSDFDHLWDLRLPFIVDCNKLTRPSNRGNGREGAHRGGLNNVSGLRGKEQNNHTKAGANAGVRRSWSLKERPTELKWIQEKYEPTQRNKERKGANAKLGEFLWMRRKPEKLSEKRGLVNKLSALAQEHMPQASLKIAPLNNNIISQETITFEDTTMAPEEDSENLRLDSPLIRRRYSQRQADKLRIPTPPPLSGRLVRYHSNITPIRRTNLNPMLFHPSFNIVSDALHENGEDIDEHNSFEVLKKCRYLRMPRYQPTPMSVDKVFE